MTSKNPQSTNQFKNLNPQLKTLSSFNQIKHIPSQQQAAKLKYKSTSSLSKKHQTMIEKLKRQTQQLKQMKQSISVSKYSRIVHMRRYSHVKLVYNNQDECGNKDVYEPKQQRRSLASSKFRVNSHKSSEKLTTLINKDENLDVLKQFIINSTTKQSNVIVSGQQNTQKTNKEEQENLIMVSNQNQIKNQSEQVIRQQQQKTIKKQADQYASQSEQSLSQIINPNENDQQTDKNNVSSLNKNTSIQPNHPQKYNKKIPYSQSKFSKTDQSSNLFFIGNRQLDQPIQKIHKVRFEQKLKQTKQRILKNKLKLLQNQATFKLQKKIKQNLNLIQKQKQLNQIILKGMQRQRQKQKINQKLKQQKRFIHQSKLIKTNICKIFRKKFENEEKILRKSKSQESVLNMTFNRFLKQKKDIQKLQQLAYKFEFLKCQKKHTNNLNKINSSSNRINSSSNKIQAKFNKINSSSNFNPQQKDLRNYTQSSRISSVVTKSKRSLSVTKNS